MKKLLVIILLITFININLFSQERNRNQNFKVIDIYGKMHQLSDYLNDGKYVYIEFFSHLCYSCAQEAPYIDTTFRNFGCNTGEVIFIALEQQGNNFDIWEFKHGLDLTYPIASGYEGNARPVFDDFNITYTPQSRLVAPNGDVVMENVYIENTAVLRDTLQTYGLNLQQCEGNNFLYYGIITDTDTIVGNINSGNQTVTLNVPLDFNVNNLTSIFASSSNSNTYIGTTEQISEQTINNFSSGSISYRITSETDNYKDWIVFVNQVASIKNISTNDFKIYPNPTSNFIEIDSEIKNYDVQISNISGQILFSEKKNKSSRINISNLPKGIYFIQISNSDFNFTKKIFVE